MNKRIVAALSAAALVAFCGRVKDLTSDERLERDPARSDALTRPPAPAVTYSTR
jgi:hypothetical protein